MSSKVNKYTEVARCGLFLWYSYAIVLLNAAFYDGAVQCEHFVSVTCRLEQFKFLVDKNIAALLVHG